VYARLHTIEATPEQHEQGLELIREDLLPWSRESTGFCGLIGLRNPETGTDLVLTLWADEDALRASAAAGDELSRLAAEATGAVRRSLVDYEVTHYELLR
jgi:hypothetical protein